MTYSQINPPKGGGFLPLTKRRFKVKSEEEIKEMLKKLDSKDKQIKELDEEGFLRWSDKAGHWVDCLDWVLSK